MRPNFRIIKNGCRRPHQFSNHGYRQNFFLETSLFDGRPRFRKHRVGNSAVIICLAVLANATSNEASCASQPVHATIETTSTSRVLRQPRAHLDVACCSSAHRAQRFPASASPWRRYRTIALVRRRCWDTPGRGLGRRSYRCRCYYGQVTPLHAKETPIRHCSCGGFQRRCRALAHSRCSVPTSLEALLHRPWGGRSAGRCSRNLPTS